MKGWKRGVKQMGEWRQHYRWPPQGGTHNSAVIRMLTAFEVARGCHVTTLCTHIHKSAAPENTKSPDERTEESCPGRATYPDLTKRWHPTGETRDTWTTRFILLIEKKFSWRYIMYRTGVLWTALQWTLASKHFTRPPWSLLLSGCSSYSL